MASSNNAPVVLLVQTNDDSLEMYREFLAHKGLTAVAVYDADDALSNARNVDVIITGIRLDGDIDGIELVSRVRLDDDTKHKPIIVLTSSTGNTERQRAESAGCDLFLTKPCLPDELLREVHLLLASSKIGTRRERPAKANLREEPDARRNPK